MFLLCNFIYFIIVSPMLLMFYCSCHYTLPTSCTLVPTKQCGCSNSDDSVPVGNRKPKYSRVENGTASFMNAFPDRTLHNVDMIAYPPMLRLVSTGAAGG